MAYVAVVVSASNRWALTTVELIPSQVRFGLSSEDTFSDDGGTFKYINFYTQLREYLEAPKHQPTVAPLLAWWNRYVISTLPNREELTLDF